jgi:uncharacterized protein YecE (DUF72 family)
MEQNALAALLLQFPYSFKRNAGNLEYLKRLFGLLRPLPLVVEFRSSGWANEESFAFLKREKVGFCNVDEPALKGLLPHTELLCSPVAYLRFHGRNKNNWWKGDSASRYDYLYGEEELKEWVSAIYSFIKKADLVLIYFNNHWQGQAAINAKQMATLTASERS